MKMKRYGLYKRIFIPLLLFASVAGSAWGQDEIVPIENDKAGTVSYGTNVDVSKDARIPITSLEVIAGSEVTNNNSSQNNKNTGRPRNDLMNIYDGIVDGNSWCEFSPESENEPFQGQVGLVIMFNPAFVIDKIEIIRGAQSYECPKEIEIQYGYTGTGGEQYDAYKFTSLQENSNTVGKPMLISLKSPINLNQTDERANAIVLLFTPSDDLNGNNFALDEIILHGYYNLEVTHRTTKWKNLHESVTQDDSFNSCKWFDSDNSSVFEGIDMQPAHHYTDTIYMKKGETRTLVLPDRNTDATTYAEINNKSYQRWYDYKTDGLIGALRPKSADENNLIPIKNGFLALPYQQLVDDNQYTPTPYQIDFTYPTNGENSYIIACDVSNYIDVDLNLSGKDQIQEPTLSHRVLYYIKAISEETMDVNYYHEEYDISFPFTRISNHTLDIVALSKDADAYAFPGDNEEGLTVTITEPQTGGAGITLAPPVDYSENDTWFTVAADGKSATLSGNHRTISFKYPNKRDDGTRFVGPALDDGTTDNYTATITVTKGNYKIATYNLTFKRNTVLLTQSIISEIEKPAETEGRDNKWDAYQFRTPQTLSENYGMPITELNWDYTAESVGPDYSSHYYRFPMDWSYSTYGFFDGSQSSQIIASIREHPYPEWGHYAITDGYIESLNNSQEWAWPSDHTSPAPKNKLTNSSGVESTYHLYVDASDRPGTIARLTFDGDLCTGSEIIVSAWVKSAAAWNKDGSNDDASVLFTIMGVKDEVIDGTTREVRVPLYRHCTGQIRNTLYMNESIPGCGEDNNEWLQVYFSFINDAQPNEYKEYLLQVDNYSASSNGADIYFDDIRCYVAKPRPRVTQQKLTCGERTRVRMDLNWEQLISRLGLEELTNGSDTDNGIDFCFIDVEEYENALEGGKEFADALETAAVEIGNVTDYNKKYGSLYYDLNYEKNTEYTSYDISQDGDGDFGSLASNNAKNEDSKYFFYRATAGENDAPYANGERLLSVNFYANMSLAREYMILIRDRNSTSGAADDFSSFGNPENPCAITANFQVQGQNLIKMNGEVVKPGETNDYCTGQIFDFSVDMQYLIDGKYVSYTNDDIYFDWFFGTEGEFNGTDENTNTDEESLRDALYALRTTIGDVEATSVWDETEEKWKLQQSADKTELGSEYVTVIEKYLNEKPDDDRLQAKLVLRSKTLEIRILEHGLDLVVAPIDTRDQSSTGANITLCFEPMYLHLTAANKAPQIQPGFEDVVYESEDYNPAMRIGLAQIKASSGENGKEITVNLRNAKFALKDEEYKGEKPDHIGLLYNTDESKPANNPIYLTGSNDPALEAILNPTDDSTFDSRQYVIGTVESLEAKPNAENVEANKMTVKFNYNQPMGTTDDSPIFNPREGYEYTFTVEIEEHSQNHDKTDFGNCRGNFNLTMKVVPEYLVWQGTNNTQNWNNDALWKRATKEQLKKSSSDEYKDYDDASTPGYVPMLFSKVIIPSSGKVELYQAGFEETNSEKSWQTDRPNHIVPPSMDEMGNHPIQYDMMVYTDDNGDMSTKPYRTPLCDHIHFEPGAEMLHAEYLQYDTAWVEYELEKDKWHTLASPLQAVVSGDWYTATSGRQETEYFKDITFDDKDNNYSRLDPEVYQRGWGRDATMVEKETESGNVIVNGNWSGVYNNVNESFTPGSGFSVKVIDGKASGTSTADNDKALFRFPKSDEKYSYQSNDNGNPSNETNIERSNGKSGKLQSDGLTSEEASFTVKLHAANGTSAYYLVGNPFMTALNMTAFFEKNTNLENKYWYITDDKQNIAAGDITTSSATSVPALQSFFVQKSGTTNSVTDAETVTFTAEMQTLSSETTGETTNSNAMLLTATTADGRQSRAAIAYDGSASAGYEADEDAELFLDSNLSDVPAVYTVAGTMATSINRTSELWNIPVGVYGDDNETVTLSFSGLNGFSGAMFYDAEKKVETPLYEGKEIAVSANTGGRYFIRATAMPTANEPVIAHKSILIYSLGNGKALVTSEGNPLSTVSVYNMNGALIRQEKCSGNRHELHLPKGVYLIVASDSEGLQENGKVLLR